MESLLVKYMLGELAPDEKSRVDQWLSENEQNRQLFEEFKRVWETSRMAAIRPSTIKAEEALIRFRERLKTEGLAGENKQPIAKVSAARGIFRSLVQWRVAALLTGILSGTLMVLIIQPFKKTQPVAEKTVAKSMEVPENNRAGVPKTAALHKDVAGHLVLTDTLPDRSVITLNRNAAIEYASGLTGAQRRVKLSGEAFFAVTHDTSRPFVVQVNNITVQDIGTSFNVLGTPGATEITVESGTVLVTRGSDSLMVYPGEKAIELPGGRLKKELSGDELYGYYLDRPLVCDSMSLQILVKILNKAYNAHITIEKKELNDLRLTTTFPAKLPLDRILSVIAATFDISIGRIGNRPLIILK